MKKARTTTHEPPAAGAGESRRWYFLAAAAAALFLALTLHAAWVETPTVDEFAYVPAGLSYWRHGQHGFFPTNPPLVKYLLALPLAFDSSVQVPPVDEPPLDWGPWLYGNRFQAANSARYFQIFFRARLVVIVMALLCGVAVFAWARRLFGPRAASIAAALFFLCPNLLAHGHLATIDIACMLSIFLALACLSWMYLRPSWGRAALAGAALGLAFAVKYIALLLPPIVIAVAAVHRWREPDVPTGTRVRRLAAELALIFLVALAVLNASAGFDGSFAPLGGYSFRSGFCRGLQGWLPSWLPVPLPRIYLTGFDVVKQLAEQSEFGSYLHGEWRQHGWWYYNLVAFGLKMPLPVLILMAWSFGAIRRGGIAAARIFDLLLPPVALFALFATFSRVNLGLRHVLAAFPFLFVACGAVFTAERWRLRPKLHLAVASVALAGSLLIAARIHPDYLTFFNSIAGGPGGGADWLIDSNLDWGQDLYRVPEVARRLKGDKPIRLLYFGHVDPRLYGIRFQLMPATPVKDVIAVSENFLRGYTYAAPSPEGNFVNIDGRRAEWLRGRTPVARLGSILVFDTRDSAAGSTEPE